MRSSAAGLRKSAILLLSLPGKQAEAILARVSHESAEQVRAQMVAIGKIADDERTTVMREYQQEVLNDPQPPRESPGLELLDPVEAWGPLDLAERLHAEHPQTIAAVLATAAAQKSGWCLAQFPVQRQIDVFCRMESMRPLERHVRSELLRLLGAPPSRLAPDSHSDASLLSQLLDDACECRPCHVQRDEAYVAPDDLTFNDLLRLNDGQLRILLDEISPEDLAISLHAASQSVRERIDSVRIPQSSARHVSVPATNSPQLSDICSAQTRILRSLYRLQAAGEIRLEWPEGRTS